MPELKMQALLSVEGPCPCCNSKNTSYKQVYRNGYNIWQNSYICNDCHSEWLGNSYDTSFRRVTETEEERYKNKNSNFLVMLFS